MDVMPSRPTVITTRPLFRVKGRALRAIPRAVPTCRRTIRAGLLAHGLADLADDACSVTAELAANAVNAMRIEQQTGRLGRLPPVMVLSVEWMTAGVRIGLWDDSPGVPEVRAADWDAETGRGLFIVNALTGGRWGWFAADSGKCVWAEIVRAAGEPGRLTESPGHAVAFSRPTPRLPTGRPRTGRRSRNGDRGTRRT